MLLQANDYLWLHDHLRLRPADRWFRSVGQPPVGSRPHPPTPGDSRPTRLTWPLLLRTDGRSSARRPATRVWLARPQRDQPVPVPPALVRPTTPRSPSNCRRFSCDRSRRSRRSSPTTRRAPNAASPNGHSADELTELVHGAAAADAADAAADVLFGGDPTTASAAGARRRARRGADHDAAAERPRRPGRPARRDRPGVARAAMPAGSSSSGRPGQTASNSARRRPGRDVPLLHERYLLLRKGKHTYHLVEISPRGG